MTRRPLLERPTLTTNGQVIGRSRREPPPDAASLIRDLAADGWSKLGIGAKLGTSDEILRRWLTDHPALAEAFAYGREKERHTLHNRLFRIATESDDEKAASIAAMFLLKARHGYREGELPPDSGARVNVNIVLPAARPLSDFINPANGSDPNSIPTPRP